MSELDDFLAWVETRQREAEVALLNGDAEPRLAIWSRNDPVTLLGAWFSATGWEDISRTFQRLASIFSHCTSYERDIVAAGVNGDLAYTVGYERIAVSVNGTPSPHTLRATHVYRREDGEWKVVHRHADAPPTPPSEVSD